MKKCKIQIEKEPLSSEMHITDDIRLINLVRQVNESIKDLHIDIESPLDKITLTQGAEIIGDLSIKELVEFVINKR